MTFDQFPQFIFFLCKLFFVMIFCWPFWLEICSLFQQPVNYKEYYYLKYALLNYICLLIFAVVNHRGRKKYSDFFKVGISERETVRHKH